MNVKVAWQVLEPFAIFIVAGIMLLAGVGFWVYNSYTSTPTSIPVQFAADKVVVVLTDTGRLPMDLRAELLNKDKDSKMTIPALYSEWTKSALVRAAQERGITIQVRQVSDVVALKDGHSYQASIIELPVDMDSFAAIQQLILIDFVVTARNNEHHAIKRGCTLEIK